MAAEEEDDLERVNGLLCGAVKLLRGQRAKPDQLLYLALMFLAKSKSYIFSGQFSSQISELDMYRVTLVVEYLDWVELNLGCSTILLWQ